MKTTSSLITKSSRIARGVAGVTSLLALLAFGQSAQAADTATSAWNGSSDSTWVTPGNWAGSVLPSSTVSALFNSTFTNQPTLDAAQTAQGLWLASSVGQDVTINSGAR